MEHLRHLLPFVRRYRGRIFLGFLCALIDAILSSSIPLIVRNAVNDLNTLGVVQQSLLRYGGILLALSFGAGLCRYGQRMFVGGTAYLIEFDFREGMFNRLLKLDQGFYGQSHTGDLMTRVTNDLSSVRQFCGPGVNSLMNIVLFGTASAILMLQTNVILALMVLLLLPLVSILFMVVGARMRRVYRNVQDQFGSISTRAQENFSGIRTIKAYAQEESELVTFREANEHYRTLNVRYVLMSGILWPAIGTLLGLISALVLLVGGQYVANGTMSLGDLVLFNTYLGLLAFPMINLGWTVNLYQQATASLGRITEVLYRQPAIDTAANASTPASIGGAISFRSVGVKFDRNAPEEETASDAIARNRRDTWMLRDISFDVPQGSSLAIVGATGAGKTTLVNLLARVRDPDAGQVLIDGQDVRALPLDTIRQAIGYVPQDTFLFSVPIRENVTFGRTDATEQDIDRALTVSRLSNDVSQFPGGIDTMIGERGVTLSGGQKQRTAIARAVLRDPQILVLDDALSSVDTHTADEILRGLREVMQDRTSIIIAQRIATVKNADQIIVLHNGRIIERGSHRSLLEQGGRYAAMYRRELLEAELNDE